MFRTLTCQEIADREVQEILERRCKECETLILEGDYCQLCKKEKFGPFKEFD